MSTLKVWTIEWQYPSDAEFKVTVWSTEKEALQAALHDIQNQITHDWDMDDETQAEFADEINLHIHHGRLKEAVRKWNDYQDDHNFDYGQWYFINEKPVLSDPQLPLPTTPTIPVPYQATTPGATCRKCNNPNPHAYADKPDGTYCCRQCSIFSNIFGTKP